MKYLVGLIVVFLCSCKHPDSGDIDIGKTEHLHSNILGEDRKFFVHVPDNDLSRHYPVVYLLDGDAHFSSVTGMIDQISESNGNTACPPMIVVGIPNTVRMRDLTPTRGKDSLSGGGEAFTSFLEKELIPYIDAHYPTAPYRMLIGHSLGGLMVMNTLVHHTSLFNAYIAIDPSMWWDKQHLLKECDTAFIPDRFKGRTLYLGIANTMPTDLDTSRVRRDTTEATIHIRSILQLTDILRRNGQDGLRWSYAYHPDDNHGLVPLITEYEGLRFIFDYYYYPQESQLFSGGISDADAILSLKNHFAIISERMGYLVMPPKDFVNQLAQGMERNGMKNRAMAFLSLNAANYPEDEDIKKRIKAASNK